MQNPPIVLHVPHNFVESINFYPLGQQQPNVDYVNIHDLDEICRGDYDLNKEQVKKRIAEIVKSIAQKFLGMIED